VISLLMTRRIRQVPPSGAKVSPVRRACAIWVAVATVNASTRRLGKLTETGWSPHSPPTTARTVSSIEEKSAVDSEVSATSS
jgi:hypothetical protein